MSARVHEACPAAIIALAIPVMLPSRKMCYEWSKGTLMLGTQGQQPDCEVCRCQQPPPALTHWQYTQPIAQSSLQPNIHSL